MYKIKFSTTHLGLGNVTCNGVLISSRIQQSLYHSILHFKLVTRLAGLLHINIPMFRKTVHWKLLGTARKEVNHQTKIFMSKWVSSDTATGTVMTKSKQRINSNCPLWNEPGEDTIHILRFESLVTSTLRDNLLVEMQRWLKSMDTYSDITDFIIKGITNWSKYSNTFFLDTTVDPKLLLAFKTQLLLG